MNARADRTRAELVRATARLVGEVGYAQTTTRAIARAAGVAEGTMYRHFPDKAALFLAALAEQHGPILESVARLPARAGTGTVAGNLADCLLELASLREAVLPLELALLADPELAGHRPPPTGPLPGPPGHLADHLAAEQRLGRVRSDADPRQAALVLLAVLFGLAVGPMPAPGRADPETLRGAVDLLMTGLAP